MTELTFTLESIKSLWSYLCCTIVLGMCILADAELSDYDSILCATDTDCPQSSVCGYNGSCTSPYDLSHLCGDEVFCGPTAECVNGSCMSLFNIGDNCGECGKVY